MTPQAAAKAPDFPKSKEACWASFENVHFCGWASSRLFARSCLAASGCPAPGAERSRAAASRSNR
jgi:hypothetical protein